jgi:hypothetical protein
MPQEEKMPYISDWKPAAVAFLIEGFPVYYCYKNNECNMEDAITLDCWYQICVDEDNFWDPDSWYVFDVRTLPEYKADDEARKLVYDEGFRELHRDILRKALLSGSIRFLQEMQFPPEERMWKVDITRTVSQTQTVSVTARSSAEAEQAAMARAGDYDFSDLPKTEPEYEAEAYHE